MPTATNVVTSERFYQGLTYGEFMSRITVNRDKFEQNYRNPVLTEEDMTFFQTVSKLPEGPRKLLAIAEAWCGDVHRELPTAVRIAESAGIDLRIFPRDQNPDIMNEFLSNNGNSRSIPVFVFYTADTKYIAHFTERSATAHAALALAMEQARMRLGLPHSASFGNTPDAERQAFLGEVISRIEPHTDQWRRDAVREIRQLLATALRVPDLTK